MTTLDFHRCLAWCYRVVWLTHLLGPGYGAVLPLRRVRNSYICAVWEVGRRDRCGERKQRKDTHRPGVAAFSSWEESPGLAQQIRRSQATPNPKRFLQRQARLLSLGAAAFGARTRHVSFVALEGASSYLAGLVGLRGLRLALNTSVAVLVLSLPFAATAASRASTVAPPSVGATAATSDASRAQPVARSGAIAGGRNPVTVAAEGTRPVQEVTIHDGDTLATMANYYDEIGRAHV